MYNWSYPELKVYKTENYFKKKLEKKLFLFFLKQLYMYIKMVTNTVPVYV